MQKFSALIYPPELFEEFDDPTNLIVLIHKEHAMYENKPPSFFLRIIKNK